MLIDASGRLFGRFNVIDFSSLFLLFLVALGVIVVQSGWHQTSGQMVKGEADIEYKVFLRNAKSLRQDLFKPGDHLSITIRNQPRGNVLITGAEAVQRQLVMPVIAGKYKLIEDPTERYGYDFLVTLRDHAQVTSDGYVTNGIKVKTGMTVDVEGFDYRLPAVIIDVREVK